MFRHCLVFSMRFLDAVHPHDMRLNESPSFLRQQRALGTLVFLIGFQTDQALFAQLLKAEFNVCLLTKSRSLIWLWVAAPS